MKKAKKSRLHDLTGKVLVIEDDPSILDAVRMTLEYAGYAVATTDRGDTASAIAENADDLPRLIILDILLSGKDGRDICRELKSRSVTQHIPIIMMSAHPRAEESVKDAGADEFISKPFEVDDFLAKVRAYTP